ncbi:12416_t:CDS:1 [Funneliformis caledonium]|uniref:glucan endo-1,3-beta-D-glucosidase n=1 Tax=Funneliformis caledonium TaxID=1117310 RepID=A0A9N8ZBT5_9GLOM|nr:12416_t:CDS:1 [Funneliformis caledonium]
MGHPEKSEWLRLQQKSQKKYRFIVAAIGIIVLLCVVGGVGYAYLMKNKGAEINSDNNIDVSNDDKKSGDPTANGQTYFTWDKKPVNLTITPNPALKKAFYGINYGPVNATFPGCTNTLGDVIEDVKLISQLTNRIRLYGMDCHMSDWTLEAIKLLKLDMTIVPTIWVDDNDTTYKRQHDTLIDMVKKYGIDNIDGVSVGNEVLFRKEVTPEKLYGRMADVRKEINSMGFNKKLPVFTSDLGSNVDAAYVAANDIMWANVHPYFGGVPVEQAGQWTFDFFNENDVKPAKAAGKDAIISEVGWPTAGASESAAVASIPNLQTFLNTFVCDANKLNTKYYYFETFDTPWKERTWTKLEGSWGLFYDDRSLKPGITIPDCLVG